MASIIQSSRGQSAAAEAPAGLSWAAELDASAARTDALVLVAALFLQRFSLPFHDTTLQLDLVVIGLILGYQFLRGKLLVQYDRLLWYVPLALVATSSRLVNPKSSMTAYLLFVVFNALFTLRNRSNFEQYRKTLQSFQFLVLLLACLGIAQFFAQFVLNPREIINFYGIFPDTLFTSAPYSGGTADNGLIRSNGIFLAEPATLSQMTALAILIEVLEFNRPRYLLGLALGFLVSYSGTGVMLLLVFLPIAGLRQGRAGLSVLLVVTFALGLSATGIIDPSAFTARVNEFETPGTSGYSRFISPFWLAAKQFNTGLLPQLLIGSGPGTVKSFASAWVNSWYSGGFAATWIKYLYEYGIIGTIIFGCFLAACLRRSKCPGLVTAAIILAWVFLQGGMTITIPLCTLNGPKLRRIGEAARHNPSLVAASGSG